jgi:uncharacterized membrane protein
MVEMERRNLRSCLALGAAFVVIAESGVAAAASSADVADAEPVARQLIYAGMDWLATGIEIAGVAIIVIGAIAATAAFLYGGLVTIGWPSAFRFYRANLGRGILLGLELLVAADIIGTVAVAPSFESLAVLGCIVLIRTFLSFSLEVEIEGRWPWQRRQQDSSTPKQQL